MKTYKVWVEYEDDAGERQVTVFGDSVCVILGVAMPVKEDGQQQLTGMIIGTRDDMAPLTVYTMSVLRDFLGPERMAECVDFSDKVVDDIRMEDL